jgi:urate oxidase
MERTFALIKGTSVINSIVADDSFIDLIKDDYTTIIETTNLEVKPGVTAVYDFETNTFGYPQIIISQPSVVEPTE